jgi:hypothetical protein
MEAQITGKQQTKFDLIVNTLNSKVERGNVLASRILVKLQEIDNIPGNEKKSEETKPEMKSLVNDFNRLTEDLSLLVDRLEEVVSRFDSLI